MENQKYGIQQTEDMFDLAISLKTALEKAKDGDGKLDIKTDFVHFIQRIKKYPIRIKTGSLHKDHANKQYKRMEAVEQALSVMTEEEWRSLRYRFTHKVSAKPGELFPAA